MALIALDDADAVIDNFRRRFSVSSLKGLKEPLQSDNEKKRKCLLPLSKEASEEARGGGGGGGGKQDRIVGLGHTQPSRNSGRKNLPWQPKEYLPRCSLVVYHGVPGSRYRCDSDTRPTPPVPQQPGLSQFVCAVLFYYNASNAQPGVNAPGRYFQRK